MIDEKKYTSFYLVRHGQTTANCSNLLQGALDAPLSEKGEGQAVARRAYFKDIALDAVFCSDLIRAQRTAEIITLEREIAVTTNALLRERFFGSHEGRPISDWLEENKELIEKFHTLTHEERWKLEFPGGVETLESLNTRFITFIREIGATYEGKNVLVVAHGGILRTFLLHIGWGTYEELPWGCMDNAAVIHLLSDGIDFFIQSVDGVKKSDVRPTSDTRRISEVII